MELININRFHPLLVHLPIGILFLAALMQMYQWRKKTEQFNEAIQFALLISFGFSCLAIFTGWRLAGEGGYDEDLVWSHKWLGISMTLITLLLYLAKTKRSKWSPVLFAIVLGLLAATGHNGGALTHGSEYLFTHPTSQRPQIEHIEKANAFDAVVLPILNDKCISCHNASKLKGELLMTTKEGLLAGGEHGAIFNLDNPEKSELLQRVALPLTDELHMPPKGKKQMSRDEVKILQWWIQNKACFDCVVENMEGLEEMLPLLKAYEKSEDDGPGSDLAQLTDVQLSELRAAGISVERVAANSPFVNVSLARLSNVESRHTKHLKNIAEHILELDISNSAFKEEDAWIFKKLVHLRNLRLQKTKIGSAGLENLKKLEFLESVNAYDTPIDDASINYLQSLPSLKRIYVWGTGISEKGLAELASAKPDLIIEGGVPVSIFGKSELKTPELIAEQTYFKDNAELEFKSNSPSVLIYYTLDGNEPDTNSLIYKTPISLSETSSIKYFASKEGWKDSPVDSARFVKSSAAIELAKLNKAPNENYPGQGAASIYDLKHGTGDFRDGNWIGYQGSHFSASLQLSEKQSISKVNVGCISAQPSWIFYPQGFKVWTSQDGKDFQLARNYMLDKVQRLDDTQQKIFEISIPEVVAEFVKVEVLSQLENPEWHGTPGGASWVFVDEILLE